MLKKFGDYPAGLLPENAKVGFAIKGETVDEPYIQCADPVHTIEQAFAYDKRVLEPLLKTHTQENDSYYNQLKDIKKTKAHKIKQVENWEAEQLHDLYTPPDLIERLQSLEQDS